MVSARKTNFHSFLFCSLADLSTEVDVVPQRLRAFRLVRVAGMSVTAGAADLFARLETRSPSNCARLMQIVEHFRANKRNYSLFRLDLVGF